MRHKNDYTRTKIVQIWYVLFLFTYILYIEKWIKNWRSAEKRTWFCRDVKKYQCKRIFNKQSMLCVTCPMDGTIIFIGHSLWEYLVTGSSSICSFFSMCALIWFNRKIYMISYQGLFVIFHTWMDQKKTQVLSFEKAYIYFRIYYIHVLKQVTIL